MRTETAAEDILFWQAPKGNGWKDEAAKYVIYRFDSGEKVDTNSPRNIIAITGNTFYKLPYEDGKKKYTYVVTALDRMSNESKNLFVGVGGSDMISKSHMVSAVYGIENVMGKDGSPVRKLFERYDNVPASLADACPVRMSELFEPCSILTLDSDFGIYRRHGRKTIPVMSPHA